MYIYIEFAQSLIYSWIKIFLFLLLINMKFLSNNEFIFKTYTKIIIKERKNYANIQKNATFF